MAGQPSLIQPPFQQAFLYISFSRPTPRNHSRIAAEGPTVKPFRTYPFRQPGFWSLRVERDGMNLSDGIEVSPGIQLAGVRVVLAYVTGVIRGQVTILNYELPHNIHLQISARRLGDEGAFNHFSAETDDRGRFTFEGLAPGADESSAGASFVTRGSE